MSITKNAPKAGQKAGQLVDSKHVDSLLSTYKKERWVHNTKRLGKEDSLSVWYGLNELNEFLQIARNNGADGIRMYFGVYPDDFEMVPEYRGRQTVVMVATKTKEDNNGRLVTKHVYHNTERGTELLAFNLSSLCPPTCYPATPDADSGYIIQDQGIGLTFLSNDTGDMMVL